MSKVEDIKDSDIPEHLKETRATKALPNAVRWVLENSPRVWLVAMIVMLCIGLGLILWIKKLSSENEELLRKIRNLEHQLYDQ